MRIVQVEDRFRRACPGGATTVSYQARKKLLFRTRLCSPGFARRTESGAEIRRGLITVANQLPSRPGQARRKCSVAGRRDPRAYPDVPALEHPVPRPTASPSTWSPKLSDRLTLTCLKNLDVFNMFPSIESAGRRFAFLHWVLRGEFPSFNGTIKALRHPTAISPHFVSFAWRYLGFTRCVRSLADE